MPDRVRVHIDGRELELSNLSKVLYPDSGFTKGEVIDYYVRVAAVLLPHLRDRPLTRIRYPNGVNAPSFFEKNAPLGTPAWVRRHTLPVPGSSTGRETLDFIVADEVATLVWLANLAAIELHTPQWRLNGGDPADPDLLVVDLDPGPGVGLAECSLVAVAARHRLALDGLAPLAKTSGKKGMQLLARLPGGQTSAEVADYARRVAEDLAEALPELVTAKMTKALRPGKVFFDWSQNAAAKTTVSPYSLRAGPAPTVSAPFTWDEVDAGQVRPLRTAEVLDRIERYGDLLAPLLGPPARTG
ncbi:MAG TPA: non-homologous end-joining DNA ligase [Micromonosporaceae bacterium]